MAVVAGHFGELMQGRIGPEGPVALVTLPCAEFTASVTREAPGALALDDPAGVLAVPAAAAMLAHLRLAPEGRFSLRLTMPPGGGAGASSAALMALAQAAGASDAGAITRAALAVEGATDPLLFAAPERVLWASRLGRVLAHLPALPQFQVLGGFRGPGRRTDPADEVFPDISDLVARWDSACGDLALLAGVISDSARRTLALRGPLGDPTEALAHAQGALGFVIAHTGSARGLIYPPGPLPAGAAAALQAAGFSQITRFDAGG